MSNCVFCKIVVGEVPADRVYEDESTLAFLDIRPVNAGHTLLVPKEHFPNLLEAPEEVLSQLIHLLPKVARAVVRGVGAPAFNVGVNNEEAAGQLVPHLHVHIIPRFADDGHRSWSQRVYKPGEAEQVAERIRRALA